jgi:hypothetical protein
MAQRRVQQLEIIVLLDELLTVRPQVVQILVFVRVDLFPLERLHGAFATGIVIRFASRLMLGMISCFGKILR